MAKAVATKPLQRGIAFWMERVVAECEKVQKSFDSEAVHDLRVALRRCRSMGEGFQGIDGDPSWKKMRRAGKVVFAALGDLRDTQVMLEWIERLSDDCPPVAERLKAHCLQREVELKESAAEAVNGFDTQRWLNWAQKLEGRVKIIGNPTEIFQVLALENLEAAHALHARALRNRSKTALHELRIGVKKLRYVVENFLPEQNRQWGEELKNIQDVLGEVHDLDVLWSTALQIHAFASLDERQRWSAAISRERMQRVHAYREKMVGRHSLWHEWRSGLPSGALLHRAVLMRFEAWGASLDTDPAHTHAVAHFSLQLYDALQDAGLIPARGKSAVASRDLLQVAAHTVGVGDVGAKASHKVSARLLLKLKPPPGWSDADMLISALVARCQRGALPASRKSYVELSSENQHLADCLGGILRLAESLDGEHDQAIREISVHQGNGRIEIIADGYDPLSKQAEKIAAARHLLEHAFNIALILREPGEQQAPEAAE